MTKSELTGWLTNWVSMELKLDRAVLETGKTLVAYGMDSVHAMMLVGDLEELLDRSLHPTLAWDHPTIDSIAAFLGVPDSKELSDADLLAEVDCLTDDEVERLLAAKSKAALA
jgi:acyl carrier protein